MEATREVNADGAPHSLRLIRYLAERSPLPVVALEGEDHTVVYLSPAFARLVGQPAEALLGRPFREAVPEDPGNGCLALLDRVLHTGDTETLPDQQHLWATPIYWSYLAWAMAEEDERPAGVMLQVTDSTDMVIFRARAAAMNEALLIAALQQHERLQEDVRRRDHFIAALSHELRNPLAPLSAGLEILKLGAADPAAAERSRTIMDRQLKQMVRLVDDLLDISRIALGTLEIRKEPVDFASVVRDAVESSRSLVDRQGHMLTVTLPDEPMLLEADPTRLSQVLLNLLNNAAKYSERGGHIRLSAWRDGDEIVVSVRDDGIGIDAADLPHIFDHFMQVDASWKRAQGGLGIGLSLVKEFVALHGGHIEAHSEGPGKGSEFVIRLAATAPAAPA